MAACLGGMYGMGKGWQEIMGVVLEEGGRERMVEEAGDREGKEWTRRVEGEEGEGNENGRQRESERRERGGRMA